MTGLRVYQTMTVQHITESQSLRVRLWQCKDDEQETYAALARKVIQPTAWVTVDVNILG